MFAGLDDPEKLKSITFENGDLTDIWIEEASEISEDAFDMLDLRLRGQNKIPFQITLTYNPISALHWLKKRFHDRTDPDNINVKSTYLDNKFIGDKDKKMLEGLKDKDPIKYEVYALGNWGVLGHLVYNNYIIEPFDDNFSQYYNGLDWGYNDPAAGLKMAFKDQVIYIIDEFYVTEKDNPELMEYAEEIWDKNTARIIADSAEPKSIKEWRKKGWLLKGAEKGKDSIKHGIGWVRSHKMVIHPRCQNFINEIQAYAYREDKQSNTLEQPVDFKNHLMDAMRYGLEPLQREQQIRFLT
jgi:phage terminase large subunit